MSPTAARPSAAMAGVECAVISQGGGRVADGGSIGIECLYPPLGSLLRRPRET